MVKSIKVIIHQSPNNEEGDIDHILTTDEKYSVDSNNKQFTQYVQYEERTGWGSSVHEKEMCEIDSGVIY